MIEQMRVFRLQNLRAWIGVLALSPGLVSCQSAGNPGAITAGAARVDLTERAWFPPVVAQQGNSCAQQAGLYYLLTAERNRERGLSSRISANRLSPYQSYAVLADSMTAGTHVEDGWQMARETGVPRESDAPRGGPGLMHGFDKYVRAAGARPASWRFLPMRSADDIRAARNLLAAGHPLACDFQIRGAKLTKLPGSGETLVREWGNTGPGHVMVYAGYDDNIGWDFNGDGKITNDIDITGDGRLTLADFERGAFLVVNPWGPRWGTGGRAWVPWRAHVLTNWPRSREVATVTAAGDAAPRLMLRLLIQARDRSDVVLTAGTGGKNDTNPDRTLQPLPFRQSAVPFSHPGTLSAWEVFGKTHRAGPLISKGPLAAPGGGPLEIGLDVSALGKRAGRYFLSITSAAASQPLEGTLVKASFVRLDRRGGITEEMPLSGLPSTLSGSGGQWMSR